MFKNATTRRNFIGSSLLSFGTYWWVFPKWVPQKEAGSNAALARSDTTTFMCESGNLGKDSVFTIGLLRVPSPGQFEEQIQQFRHEFNYFPRLSYGSNDRFQLPLAQQVMSWLFEESDARFEVMAFSDPIKSDNPHFPNAPARWQLIREKQAYYEQLLLRTKIQNSMIYVKYQSPLGPSPAYGQRFFSCSNAYFQATDTRTSNALQICGLLTSCVAAAHTNRRLNTVKTALVNHLKQVLDNRQLRPTMRWKDRFVFYA